MTSAAEALGDFYLSVCAGSGIHRRAGDATFSWCHHTVNAVARRNASACLILLSDENALCAPRTITASACAARHSYRCCRHGNSDDRWSPVLFDYRVALCLSHYSSIRNVATLRSIGNQCVKGSGNSKRRRFPFVCCMEPLHMRSRAGVPEELTLAFVRCSTSSALESHRTLHV
jgi:hypothetical protein